MHFTKMISDISAKYTVDTLFFMDSSLPKDIWNPKHKATQDKALKSNHSISVKKVISQ